MTGLDDVILGGFQISRPTPITYSKGTVQGFTLMSDMHIGATNVDYKLIQHELDQAKKNGDRININGDLLDLILCKDMKRFSPDVLHPRLRSRKDVVNAAIDWAVEILEPYAELIDVIGIGNHETAVENHHNIDTTKIIVERLQAAADKGKSGNTIFYGGYTGYIDYRFRRDRKNFTSDKTSDKGKRWVLYYHHGSCHGSPVTKGTIDFYRKQWVEADCVWLGHKHNRMNMHVQAIRCPEQGDDLVVREIRQIMTGAYFDTYNVQTQASIKKNGRRSNYAADLGLAPQGKGGARVLVSFLGPNESYVVQVVQ